MWEASFCIKHEQTWLLIVFKEVLLSNTGFDEKRNEIEISEAELSQPFERYYVGARK